jgi:hypothetical protein
MSTSPNVGSDLLRIHRAITRSLEIALLHSRESGPARGQREGFQRYLRALVILLNAHHQGEDEVSFPFWRVKAPQDPLDRLEQHHSQMLPWLAQISTWVESNPDWDVASLAVLHESILSLDDLWRTHIALEEDVFSPDNAARLLTLEENAQLAAQLAEHGRQHALPSELVLPFVLYNLTPQDRAGLAATMPAVITQQLVPGPWRETWAPMEPFLLM